MKIVRIDGGLGNQMFCYAFAIALQRVTGEEILIDTHRYNFFPNHNGYELSRIFDIRLSEANRNQLWKVTNPAYSLLTSRIFQYLPARKTEIKENFIKCYPTILKERKDGYYIGNWQWYGYFEDIKDEIVKQFSFKRPMNKKNKCLYDNLRYDNKTISIHVRRGDYLTTPLYSGICGVDYYRKAIDLTKMKIQGISHAVIFSNDPQWCIENINPMLDGIKTTVVNWNVGIDSSEDMRLMSMCRVNIIANSSFSWWGAYLNQRPDRIVIAPDKWINLPLEYRIQCNDWICL